MLLICYQVNLSVLLRQLIYFCLVFFCMELVRHLMPFHIVKKLTILPFETPKFITSRLKISRMKFCTKIKEQNITITIPFETSQQL